MRIGTTVNCKVLAIVTTVGKDGTEYHKLSILLSDGQSGMIKASDKVCETFEKGLVKPFTDVRVFCEYNDQYGDFRAMFFVDVK